MHEEGSPNNLPKGVRYLKMYWIKYLAYIPDVNVSVHYV